MRRFSAVALPFIALASVATFANGSPLGAARVDAVAPGATVDFEVFLPLTNKAALQDLLKAQQTAGSPSYHQWLTPQQFKARFGPSAASMARVESALAAAGLQISQTHTRSMHVSGPAAKVATLFQTKLTMVTRADGRRDIVAARPITAPSVLQQEGAVVAAFSGIRQKHIDSLRLASSDPQNRNGPAGAYNYNDLKQAYNYPSYQTILRGGKRLDGTGVNVAIVMETDALDSDIAAMFNHENFTATTGKQPPTIQHIPVDGGAPFDPNSDGSFEASLDVQQVLGGAPGAQVSLLSLPDLSDQHILDAYVLAVDQNAWDIVSSSFGGCELLYTAAYNGGTDYTWILTTYDEVFQQGAAEGITFIASSGDQGGLSCPSASYFSGDPKAKFVASVQSPADDPFVTAVGGGNLRTTPPAPPALTSKYVSEDGNGDPEVPYDPYGLGVALSNGYWGAGGGVSSVFAEPSYQSGIARAAGRIVPDVGMMVGGCPLGLAKTPCGPNRSAAIVTLAGSRYGVIGTSVAAPEFAGATALFVEAAGQRVGTLNPYLWTLGAVQDALGGVKAGSQAQFFHKNISGFDGYWHQTSTNPFGYIHGNGSPNVRTLFGLTAFAPAGNPQTPSNP